jgi:hypothetical protein
MRGGAGKGYAQNSRAPQQDRNGAYPKTSFRHPGSFVFAVITSDFAVITPDFAVITPDATIVTAVQSSVDNINKADKFVVRIVRVATEPSEP